MITYLIGLVDEVRPVKNTNRQTGEITQTLEVTVTYSSHDLEGYKVKDTEILRLPITDREKWQSYKDKFVGIPYRFISAGQRGNFLIVADDIQIETFDKSPFSASAVPAAASKK
jgi:hypothetical protein